jgi:signal transduction histidine kinase
MEGSARLVAIRKTRSSACMLIIGTMTASAGAVTPGMRHRMVTPWVVLAIAIAASLALFMVVRDAVESVARLRFEREASDIKHVIEARIKSYTDIMYGLQALLATQSPVSRIQFHRYVTSLDLKRRYPGYDVVNFATYVPARDKERFEQAVRRDTSLDPRGYPEFSIRPPGRRPEYFVIVYIEPMAGFEFAFGLDLGANPAVAGTDAKALTDLQFSARDSGTLTASGRPIRIKASKDYVGLAVRLAVYRSGMPLDTLQNRRAAYLGSVGAGFNVEELMKGVLSPEAGKYMRFNVYDVGSTETGETRKPASREWLLFESNQSIAAPNVGTVAEALFRSDLPMEFGGRVWEIQFSAPKDAVIDRVDAILPWLVLGAGLLSSGLLFGMFYSLASSHRRAVEIANEMTRDLRASTEQLQAMSRQLVDVQETERRQIARELHDRVGQNLTAISITLDIMKSQIGEGGNSALRTRLDDAAALLESTSGSIENVMSELRPPMLDDYGLLPALQWYGEEFWRRTGIRVRVEGDEQMERVPQTSEIALFRIAQEALNNVAKHAHARHVDIALARNGTHVVMSVSDDGMGFDAAPTMASRRRRPGLGMVTMRERTQAVGGQFEIGPAPGRGARVVVRVPC